MNHDTYSDDYIREILSGVKSIAMVGASPPMCGRVISPSNIWRSAAYDMIPVNPVQVGKSLFESLRRLAVDPAARRHGRDLQDIRPHHAGGR